MEKIIRHMLENRIWAVVGATQNPSKFGNKIYKRLKSAGYEVYAVNPVYEEVEGDKCYPDLASLPKKPESVNVVVAPERALGVIEEIVGLGLKEIWFQPGAFDEEVISKCEQADLDIVYHHCVLVELNNAGK